ncbi:DUF3558 domain-containing protein [Actinoalloteichus hymeniacidonis]|uniref:DUF3558 domain-containing protein n=1 Tax=Actinoalloteichus hymeniacidonis TaxID=340345 RepID=UPI001560E5D1|nr:DUF3558 domain-containing protein [Actinoalloteichus hymeniacidonis]MBB5905936.1 hypothetical protein [Actinoalloteichus hymeniacidonis]
MKHSSQLRAAALALPAAILLAACGPGSEEQADPTETASSDTTSTTVAESSSQDQELLAPPVAAPKDVSGLDTCTFLSSADATALGFDAEGIPQESAAGNSIDPCSWTTSGRSDGSGVYIYSDVDGIGLSQMYSLQGDSYPDFREFDIAGFPAVQATLGGATDTACEIHVGVADDQFITVSGGLGSDEEGDPCEQATTVAEAVISTLPAADQ